jgi:hypothetical protein
MAPPARSMSRRMSDTRRDFLEIFDSVEALD